MVVMNIIIIIIMMKSYIDFHFISTVWMKSLTIFSGALHLLHHYKSDFTHLFAFQNLVIEF